jgi:hypothetical protein
VAWKQAQLLQIPGTSVNLKESKSKIEKERRKARRN